MPLPKPNLDNRTFQDIVDEAKKRITLIAPAWTDHNVSDPGITLIELFAWMTEMIIYRLNQVPERSQITFMELMGIALEPPIAARAPITFMLTFSLSQGVLPFTIPAGTEVMTRQRSFADKRNGTASPSQIHAAANSHTSSNGVEAQRGSTWATEPTEVLIFTTEERAEVRAPEPATPALLIVDAEEHIQPHKEQRILRLFGEKPSEEASFWLGFTSDLGNQVIAIEITCDDLIKGAGIDPKDPPLVWEAWCLDGWRELPATDETRGLNQTGRIVLRLPMDMIPGHALANPSAPNHRWIRCVFRKRHPKQSIYRNSPEIASIRATGVGVTVDAINAVTVEDELLGYSDGTPGQRFQLGSHPVLPACASDTLQIQNNDGVWEDWVPAPVGHFGQSKDVSRHFLLDYASGEIALGPQIRDPDGSVRQYGAVPDRGRGLRMHRYRIGGGVVGNVPTDTLTELRRTLSYVASVNNHAPAQGGRDTETIERAKIRAPQVLRTGFRAVTAEDYEHLAHDYLNREVLSGVARVHCIQPISVDATAPAGPIRLLLVPRIEQRVASPLEIHMLNVPDSVQDTLKTYLDRHRLLTSILTIAIPTYLTIIVFVRVKAFTREQRTSVGKAIEERLYRYLNPITGGNSHGEGNGWPFGRSLYMADLIGLLQSIPGLEYIEWLTMRTADGDPSQGPIHLAADQLLISGQHQVEME